MKNQKTADDYETQNVCLMNIIADLQTQLKALQDERHKTVQILEARVKSTSKECDRLKEDVCIWSCSTCGDEYYGRSALDKGSFKCPKCTNFCVPKKFLEIGTMIPERKAA